MGDAFAAWTKFQCKLCTSVPAIEVFFSSKPGENQKKGLRRKLKCFSLKSNKDQKKKRSTLQSGTIFDRNTQDLFVTAGS